MAADSTRFGTNHAENSQISQCTEGLVEDLKRLMNNEDYSDVVFVVGSNKVRLTAHSLILTARCGKFREWCEVPNPRKPARFFEESFRAEVFRNVLEYIYTGKIELSSTNTLETLQIAQNFDIPGLVSACERYFLEKLSVENCCEFFMDSLSKHGSGDAVSGAGENVVNSCRVFIEENAGDVVESKGFVNLSKEALILLLSSDKFALPEEEIWRAVLKWAKHQANVEKPVRNWTDQEQKMVCECLSDVIGYVRLLLIDSKVFAEEVEPTGAVPMELSLERYRYAAVPDKFSSHGDNRLRARRNRNLFQGTTILCKNNVKYQDVLNHWFGNSDQEWELLYKATRDGFSAQAFHEKCDDVPQTYIIVKGVNGHICGGFTDVQWSSEYGNGKYIKSTRSFLFTLVNTEGIQPTKFKVLRPKYATLSHASLGPTFGAGADLCLADKCNTSTNSYSNMPHSYGGEATSSKLLMGDVNFKVADYEVFSPTSCAIN